MIDKLKPADFLKAAEKIKPTDLLDESLHDPDPEKRKVYDALYAYFLDRRQVSGH